MDLPQKSRLPVNVHTHDSDQRTQSKHHREHDQPVLYLSAALDLEIAIDSHKQNDCQAEVEQDKEHALSARHVYVVVKSDVAISVPHIIHRPESLLLLVLILSLLHICATSVHHLLSANMAKLGRPVRRSHLFIIRHRY